MINNVLWWYMGPVQDYWLVLEGITCVHVCVIYPKIHSLTFILANRPSNLGSNVTYSFSYGCITDCLKYDPGLNVPQLPAF